MITRFTNLLLQHCKPQTKTLFYWVCLLCLLGAIPANAHNPPPVFGATAVTTPSTCSSNGTMTITVSNGVNNFDYTISQAPSGYGGTTNFIQSTGNVLLIDALPAGVYTVQVHDANNLSTTIIVTISGNYTEPTLDSCVIRPNSSDCTIYAHDGLRPYTYAYSVNGGAFTTPQTDSLFTCLPNGNLVFRVYDACNNFYPCMNTVSISPPALLNVACNVTPTGTNVTTDDYYHYFGWLSYGELPFTYTCLS
ncbi:MAG: hypothetical protein RI894_933, partial [Bacteroidota bacterium]